MQPASEKPTILIIDDNPMFAEDVRMLGENEFHIVAAVSGEEGLRKFAESSADLVIVDLKLGRGIDGITTLQRLKEIDHDVPVIIATEYASPETAKQAERLGAAYYCSKTPSLKELRLLMAQHLEILAWRRAYREEIKRQPREFIGESPVVRQLFADLATIAPTDSLVLITGESGTGKELLAHDIHRHSQRAHRPLLTINCSNLSPNLFESEFFGHERGAFTGAERLQKGKFEQANASTLFLDEIADLPPESQPKILRAIEYGAFSRLGGQRELHADVRIIAATNKNLHEEIKNGRFREDLFYRLNRIQLYAPPLRERREDIPLLVKYFCEHYSMTMHQPLLQIPADIIEAWQCYDWPGNVRELSGEIENLMLFSKDGKIDRSHLRIQPGNPAKAVEFFKPFLDLPYEKAKEELLAHFQQDYLREHLARHEGNISHVAEATGLNRTTVYRMLADFSSTEQELLEKKEK